MKYRIKKTEGGRFNAILENPSFNWEQVYTFDTRKDAEIFIEENKLANEQRLAEVATIQEYFKA